MSISAEGEVVPFRTSPLVETVNRLEETLVFGAPRVTVGPVSPRRPADEGPVRPEREGPQRQAVGSRRPSPPEPSSTRRGTVEGPPCRPQPVE